MHTITLQFESEDQAVGWFAASRSLGAIPENVGLRQRDALDWPRGTKSSRELLVTANAGCGPWLVQSEEKDRAIEARDRRECRCGHEAHWHSHQGAGGCENNADCSCPQFQPIAREEASA